MQRPRTFNNLLMAALLVILAVGCHKIPKPNQEQEQEQNPEQPKGPYFKAELPNEYLLSYNQGGISWPVDTNIDDWTATSDAEWCKPTAKEKELGLVVENYDCRDENGYEQYDPPRTCTVTVKAGTVFSKTIKIIQDTHTIINFPQSEMSSNYDWISTGPSGMKVLLSADGQTRDIVIMSNAWRWVAETEASWLKLERIDGATLRVTSTARGESETTARSAKVKLYVESNRLNEASFTVEDAPADVNGEGYGYGDHTDWD